MKTRLKLRPISSAILSMSMCLGTAAYAQDASSTKKSSNSSTSEDQYPDLVEISPFGGVSMFGQVNRGLNEKLITGPTWGGRVAVNVSKYVGLELAYNYMVNNVRLVTPIQPGLPSYDFSDRIHMGSFNPIFNFTPRGSRFQPYITAGPSVLDYLPSNGKGVLNGVTIPNTAAINDNLQVGLNYGGGVKFHLTDHFGLRFDVRGLWSRNPTFNLPNFPNGGIYIPNKSKINGLEATAGLVWYLGQTKCPPITPPVVTPLSPGTITGAEGATLCQGKPITLHSTASDPQGHTLHYAWKLNGQAQGSDSADFSFTPNNGGDFAVEVSVTDPTVPPAPERPKDVPARCWIIPTPTARPAVTSGPITINVKEYTEPQISAVSATPNALSCAADTTGTHTANLTGTATGSACGGNLTYKWTVSEGTVSNDTTANATFDSSSLNFEGGAQEQTKTVTATLTVTDETGKSSSKTSDITVKCPPKFVRFSDVVFAKNNARVNNCGKRVLIDEVAPKLADGEYDVILVGHRDSDESANSGAGRTRKGRRAAAAAQALDEARVKNAAAVLSGGTGTCAKVDPSRIKIDWVGTDQTSTPDPALCGTSNRATQKERKSSQTSESDKNRRVEIYLVPHTGNVMPPAVKEAKPFTPAEAKLLGCPK